MGTWRFLNTSPRRWRSIAPRVCSVGGRRSDGSSCWGCRRQRQRRFLRGAVATTTTTTATATQNLRPRPHRVRLRRPAPRRRQLQARTSWRGDHVPRPPGRSCIGVPRVGRRPAGAVLVIHENRGLTDHIRSIPRAASPPTATPLSPSTCSPRRAARESCPARATPRPPSAHAPRPPHRRPAGRARRARAARRRAPLGRDRVLLRRRHDVAAAGRRRAPAGRGRALLRARSRAAPTSPAQPNAAVLGVYAELDARVNATPRRGRGRPRGRRPHPRDRTFPGRRPRLLQRHRPALRRRGGGGRLPGDARLVRRSTSPRNSHRLVGDA